MPRTPTVDGESVLTQPTGKPPAASRRTSQQTTSDLAFLARALKAPALLAAADRLAERARKESWTHPEYLVARLQREVAARESHMASGLPILITASAQVTCASQR
ncbi:MULTISPECIES: hypothetical protein [unclassified Streptomyces]|uniref:hypothetical protein n=1 Tax=unclassified Streptomyces TaxID=2593676 RepID=UPI000372797B|nr:MULTISPECIES: hypothetical protein [unclassified Streptomyces]